GFLPLDAGIDEGKGGLAAVRHLPHKNGLRTLFRAAINAINIAQLRTGQKWLARSREHGALTCDLDGKISGRRKSLGERHLHLVRKLRAASALVESLNRIGNEADRIVALKLPRQCVGIGRGNWLSFLSRLSCWRLDRKSVV